MVITKKWFSGRKSRSVNNFVQRLDFSNLGLLVGLEASRQTYLGGLGGGAPQEKGSYIWRVSVAVRSHCTLVAKVVKQRHNCHTLPFTSRIVSVSYGLFPLDH